MSLRVGSFFADRYTIEALLGEGGMGSVYRAYDASLDRRVALKIVRPEGTARTTGGSSSNARARLLREARSAAAFTHPNAVSIYDVGEVEGVAYIAMELIEGRTLRAALSDPSFHLDTRIAWLRDIARGLAAAHRRGIIHRDVKPENVMITTDGVVKMLDFGIARRAQTAPDALGPTQMQGESLTAEGAIVGTPLYMAPEQIHGDELDARVDQFAWGVTAHEVLTGELPWGTERNALRAVADMFSRPPRRVRDRVPEVPPELEAAILRALSRDPSDRFPTMEDLIGSFAPEALPQESWRGRSLAPPPKPSRWRSPSLPRGAAAAALVVVVALAAARALRSRPPAPGDSRDAPDAGGLAVTAFPATSVHADAVATYASALRDLRSGNLDAAEDGFEKAAERDPDLAAAQVRLIALAIEHDEDSAPAYRRALQLRSRLSERDREILDAFAPLIESDPADYNEVSRRFAHLAAVRANDAEIEGDLARVELLRYDGAAALRAVERAMDLDPDYGDAAMMRVEAERTLGRFDDARAHADECFARFSASECLVERSLVAQFTGEPDALAIARKQQTLAPDSVEAAKALAGALFASGAAPAAVRVAFQPARAGMTPLVQDATDARLAILTGAFADARRLLLRVRDQVPMIRSAQATFAWTLVCLDEEMGDIEAMVDDAQTYAASLPAFSRTRGPTLADPEIPILRVLVEHGKMAPEELARRRADFVGAAAPQVGADGHAVLWLVAYALAARTRDDARDALAAAPQYGEPKYHYMGGGPVGHVHLLAGDVLGALPDLHRAARATDVFFNPVLAVRAHLDLAQALERSGDVAGACAEYGFVVRAWGAATPRSISARDARERSRALACNDSGK
jgi:serine/threonine-protein kinase